MKIYELIAKAHKLKKEASDLVYVEDYIICVQDHYDDPKVSLSKKGSIKGDLCTFIINTDGSLTADDSPNFRGDIDEAMKIVSEVIGSDVK